MKTLAESIQLNEASGIEYTCSMEDPHITVTITCDKFDQKEFEKWLKKQEGKLFWMVQGGNIDY